MKIYFFCGVIVLKLVKGKNNYQIDKIFYPDRIGINTKELMAMYDYYSSIIGKGNYLIDTFRNEEQLINILLEVGYSRSHIAEIILRGYKALSKNTKFGF